MTLEEFKAGIGDLQLGRTVILAEFDNGAEVVPEQMCELCPVFPEDFEGETDDSMMVCGFVTPESKDDDGLREFDISQIKEFVKS